MALTPVGADSGCELYCEPDLQSPGDGTSVLSLTDYSGNSRDLEGSPTQPTFRTNVINGKDVVRFTGTDEPLSNAANFTIKCGWIVMKFDASTFSDYQGVLSGLASADILTSNNSGINFFDFLIDFYEFRSTDKIYPKTGAPAPMAAFKLIFFRFWKNLSLDGVQLGQQRNLTARKFDGDIALVALYSKNFCEQEIRTHTDAIAANFGLTMEDVYPYQADKSSNEQSEQRVNFYDPPEGNRISEVITDPKRVFELKFTSRRRAEKDAMKEFHAAHYAAANQCIYRNYNTIPPEDIEGYIDSEYELAGALNNYAYGFRFKEK